MKKYVLVLCILILAPILLLEIHLKDTDEHVFDNSQPNICKIQKPRRSESIKFNNNNLSKEERLLILSMILKS